MKAKRATKQSLAQKQRWAKHRKREEALKQTRAKNARAKQLLNTLLADVDVSAIEAASLPAPMEHNITLDFLGVRFLQCVVESDAFRGKVRDALQQFDAQMKA